jgi:hypothetical protein
MTLLATTINLKGNNMNTIIEMVKDKKVKFICFKDNELIYSTECGFEFPISLEEAKGATFLPEDKATLFMRWIRKHLKVIEDAKK